MCVAVALVLSELPSDLVEGDALAGRVDLDGSWWQFRSGDAGPVPFARPDKTKRVRRRVRWPVRRARVPARPAREETAPDAGQC